ncbi:MAG: tyrosine-type recombinase/integrase [Acidobacteriota bacterium]
MSIIQIKFGDLSSLSLEEILNRMDLRESTKETYSKALKVFSNWLYENQIDKPGKEDIISFKNHLKEKKLSAFTISSYLTALRRLFTFLESQRLYPDITKGIKGVKKPKGYFKSPLIQSQIVKLLSSVDKSTIIGKRDFAIINLMLRTGLRTCEVSRANIEDIIFDSGEWILKVQGKGSDSKDDFVILVEESYKPIMEYLNMRKNYKPSDSLFISHSDRSLGKRLTISGIRKIIFNRLKEAGIKTNKISAYSFRHSSATLALMNGADIVQVKDMLRHQNINTTLIYAHNLKRISQGAEKFVRW